MVYINGRFLTQKLTGVQRFAYEMLKELLICHKGKICILIPPAEIDNAYEVNEWPIKVIGRLTNTLWEQFDLPYFLVKNNKPLLISLVNTAPCFYRKQIVSILDMTTFVNPKWFSFKFSTYYKIIVPLTARNSLNIITISEHSKKDILNFIKVPQEKIKVIYCAVSDKFLNEPINDLSKEELLKKFNLIDGNFILGVSSLDPRKNFKRLIEAFLLLNEDIPLVIVGSKGKVFADDNLKDLIAGNDNIIFTGYVEDRDLISLYRAAKCFIYPSLYEGFGMPPLEAMACGCATIVSNTSSMPEICDKASLYVDPLDIACIRDVISGLLINQPLQMKLIELGNRRYKDFSWSSSARKLNDIVNKYI